MPWVCTRYFIRGLVGAVLCAALLASAAAPVPEDLPAVAFEQTGLYRLQVALFVFYGALLLITPASSGLIHGRLPIEISTRGARFAVEADQSTESNEAAIRKMEGDFTVLAQALANTEIETERLNKTAGSDSRQQKVSSDHD
jgi:hypothetical protein